MNEQTHEPEQAEQHRTANQTASERVANQLGTGAEQGLVQQRAEQRVVSLTVDREQDQAQTSAAEHSKEAQQAWQEDRAEDVEVAAEHWSGLDENTESLVKQIFAEAGQLADAAAQAAIDAMRQADLTQDLNAAKTSFADAQDIMGDVRREVGLLRDRGQVDTNDPEVIAESIERMDAAIDRLFDDESIASVLNLIENEQVKSTGSGLREVRLEIDIDEPLAIVNGGEWDEPFNKRFLERNTNQATKRDLTEQNELQDLEPISLAQARQLGEEAFKQAAEDMLIRRFSEVEELAAICDAARDAMRNTERSDADNRDALNRAIRGRIERGATEEARLVKEALETVDIHLRRRREQ